MSAAIANVELQLCASSFARRPPTSLRTGVPEALEPMSPSDRKVVHDTVNELDGVETTSEGLEPRRYVVIRPTSTDRGEESGEAPTEDVESLADEAQT